MKITFCFWSVGGDRVEDVDQHQEEGDEEGLAGNKFNRADKLGWEKILGESLHVSVCE